MMFASHCETQVTNFSKIQTDWNIDYRLIKHVENFV